MKNRFKKLALIFGISILVISQNGVLHVKAAELSVQKEDMPSEAEETRRENAENEEGMGEKIAEPEITKTESIEAAMVDASGVETGDDANSQNPNTEQTFPEIPNLTWANPERFIAGFYVPFENAKIKIQVNGPEETTTQWSEEPKTFGSAQTYYVNLRHCIETIDKEGDYTFKVEIFRDGEWRSSTTSNPTNYTKPPVDKKLPSVSFNVTKDGIFSCKLTNNSNSDFQLDNETGAGPGNYGFEFVICNPDGSQYEKSMGFYKETRVFDSESEFGGRIKIPGPNYTIKVRAMSTDYLNWRSGDWSDRVVIPFEDGSSNNSLPSDSSSGKHSDDSSTEAVVLEEWKPSTPDEIKRFAAYSKEKVGFTTDVKNNYVVTIQNAMQGKQCFDSFEAVLGNFVIGRTYNIFPAGNITYKMDSKASITLNIPKELQTGNREFKMICVTEKGVPVILKDIDSDPETITFATDTYYAFALIYKEITASK